MLMSLGLGFDRLPSRVMGGDTCRRVLVTERVERQCGQLAAEPGPDGHR